MEASFIEVRLGKVMRLVKIISILPADEVLGDELHAVDFIGPLLACLNHIGQVRQLVRLNHLVGKELEDRLGSLRDISISCEAHHNGAQSLGEAAALQLVTTEAEWQCTHQSSAFPIMT